MNKALNQTFPVSLLSSQHDSLLNIPWPLSTTYPYSFISTPSLPCPAISLHPCALSFRQVLHPAAAMITKLTIAHQRNAVSALTWWHLLTRSVGKSTSP